MKKGLVKFVKYSRAENGEVEEVHQTTNCIETLGDDGFPVSSNPNIVEAGVRWGEDGKYFITDIRGDYVEDSVGVIMFPTFEKAVEHLESLYSFWDTNIYAAFTPKRINKPTSKEKRMFERKYVTQMLDYDTDDLGEDLFLSGVIYRDPQSWNPDRHYLESHLCIKEVNEKEGRWELCIERSTFVSDDFEELEKKLIKWARKEGYKDELPKEGFGKLVIDSTEKNYLYKKLFSL